MLIFLITYLILIAIDCIHGMNFVGCIAYLQKKQYICKTQKVFLQKI